MMLQIEKSKRTIMGVKFDSQNDFKGAWYALSTNIIEGWEPEKSDVEELKQYLRQKTKSSTSTEFEPSEEHNPEEPDDEYAYPDSGVLRNKLNLRTYEELEQQEYQLVKNRVLDLYFEPQKVHSMKDVANIHFYLFSNLYGWAGTYRKVNISKGGNAFMAMQSFITGEQYMNDLFKDYYDNAHNLAQITTKLAAILENLNYMHPFREGNGRTQREVIRVLALAKGYELLINVRGKDHVFHQYMDGTVHADVKLLAELIKSLLEKIEK